MRVWALRLKAGAIIELLAEDGMCLSLTLTANRSQGQKQGVSLEATAVNQGRDDGGTW